MGLIELLIIIVIIGVAAYFIETLPMSAPFKTLFRVVCVIVVVLWLLQIFGITGPSIPRLR